jgi:hypothetical protein
LGGSKSTFHDLVVRFGSVRGYIGVFAFLVPTDRAPELDRRHLLTETTFSAMIQAPIYPSAGVPFLVQGGPICAFDWACICGNANQGALTIYFPSKKRRVRRG